MSNLEEALDSKIIVLGWACFCFSWDESIDPAEVCIVSVELSWKMVSYWITKGDSSQRRGRQNVNLNR